MIRSPAAAVTVLALAGCAADHAGRPVEAASHEPSRSPPSALTPGIVSQADLAICEEHPGFGVAVYDAEAQQWRRYALPTGVKLVAQDRHVWWLSEKGKSRYWRLGAGTSGTFDMPAGLLDKPPALPDEAFNPWAAVCGGRICSWRPAMGTYRVLDPLQAVWRPLPGSDQLPRARAVRSLVETKDGLRLHLAPRGYSVMRSSPDVWPVFHFDRASGVWHRDGSVPAGWPHKTLLPMSGGWWVLTKGQGTWHPADSDQTQRPPYYAVALAGGRLWGLFKATARGGRESLFVREVHSVDESGVPQPKPLATARMLPVSWDGTYLWSWGFHPTEVFRWTPGEPGPKVYTVIDAPAEAASGKPAAP